MLGIVSHSKLPIRIAAFNLGNYAHTRVERGGYTVDVYANRELEKALRPKPQFSPDPPQRLRSWWPAAGRRTRPRARTFGIGRIIGVSSIFADG